MCRCNTAKRDPDCTNPHSLSEMLVDMAFPGLDREPEPCEKCHGKGHVWGWNSSPLDWEKRECSRCLGTAVQP